MIYINIGSNLNSSTGDRLYNLKRSIELIKYYEAKNSLEVDFNFGYYTILKK